MKFVPKSVSRAGHRSLLKLSAKSPTLLVVGGVVGFGVTAVMAARATRKLDDVLTDHRAQRNALELMAPSDGKQRELISLYSGTTMRLARVYGPTLIVGSLSAAAVLSGHNILKKRHVATMMAYSGLAEEFGQYRQRVMKTVGEEVEKEIYAGAHGEWVEDPEHPGEMKREMVYADDQDSYLRPWFAEGKTLNWRTDPEVNYLHLQGVQAHLNILLELRGHMFLNEVLDALNLPRHPEGQVAGWLYNGEGDNFIDFGIFTSNDPNTIAFREHKTPDVQLNFNIDGVIWDRI